MKVLLSLCVLLLALGCQKENINKDTLNHTNNIIKFDVSFVKEWYYGVFKKKDEWKNSGGNQLPYWSNGVYQKNGNFEIVTFPLTKKTKTISLPDNELDKFSKIRVADASLQRVAFIKDLNGNIYVRLFDYIPDWDYLEQNSFDISNVENSNVRADFSGRMITRDWGNNILTRTLFKNGEVIGRGNTPKGFGSSNRTESCPIMRYCIWQQDCTISVVGDVVSNECSEFYNTQECWDEEYCPDNGDECELYGTNCTDPGNGGDECDPSAVSPQEQEFNEYVVANDKSENYDAPVTIPSQDPITDILTWNVTESPIGGWRISSDISYSYYHKVFQIISPISIEHVFDIVQYSSSTGYFVGSHSYIESTYSQTSPTQNQILNNNSPHAQGRSTVVGTVTHVMSLLPISLPFCPKEKRSTNPVRGTVNFYPK